MGIFGWSYPPGCSGTPYDEDPPCAACGLDPDQCECPICPECGELIPPLTIQQHAETYGCIIPTDFPEADPSGSW